MKQCDKVLERTLQLTELMAEIADQGDGAREDVGCGVLYGFLRDSAFKIRKMADEEKAAHIRKSGAGGKKAGDRAGVDNSAAGPNTGNKRTQTK